MGSVVSVTTTREKIYSKDYKREKLIKTNRNADVNSMLTYEFMYNLIQNQNRDKKI